MPYSIERDEFDTLEGAFHFIVLYMNEPLAAGRLRFLDNGTIGKLERIAVRKSSRGMGIGRQLTIEMVNFAKLKNVTSVKLNSQSDAMHFYEKLGFSYYGETFMEAGIVHIGMQQDHRQATIKTSTNLP